MSHSPTACPLLRVCACVHACAHACLRAHTRVCVHLAVFQPLRDGLLTSARAFAHVVTVEINNIEVTDILASHEDTLSPQPLRPDRAPGLAIDVGHEPNVTHIPRCIYMYIHGIGFGVQGRYYMKEGGVK